MQPLNPFLSAFAKSPLTSQCSPARHHILLVPTTVDLLDFRDTENGAALTDTVASDEFLGSHVLRIPSPQEQAAGPRETTANLRDVKGKPNVYHTINGRSVVIKDQVIYTNKGFRNLAHANLLQDTLWYPDALEPKSFLIFYISRPLVGIWNEAKVDSGVIAPGNAKPDPPQRNLTNPVASTDPNDMPGKKDVKTFHELLNNFPVIAKQMQAGLERLFREFTLAFERPLPPLPSANEIPDPGPDGSSANAVKRARSNSAGASNRAEVLPAARPVDDFSVEDDEDVMKACLETVVTSAIDLFQGVDKQQLSVLGATTDLTGPLVERLIERYMSQNVHHLLFPRLSVLKRPDDLKLEAKIRQMEFIDISQLGVAIDGGPKRKRQLISMLGPAIAEFRKMSIASCPQDMMDALLSTIRATTQFANAPWIDADDLQKAPSERPPMTVNADTLVSLLLYVVIRAQVKYLHARLIYVRQFIFIEDVDSGEMGYALSTLEAVLTYLDRDSSGLRRASRRNKALWDVVASGNMSELRRTLESGLTPVEGDFECAIESGPSSRRHSTSERSLKKSSPRGPSSIFTTSERFSQGSSLSHVFPFQSEENGCPEDAGLSLKKKKRVVMDVRRMSMSSSSEISFHSRTASIATSTSGIEGDTSTERLLQTQNAQGESLLMIAIQNEKAAVLDYLLSTKHYYSAQFVFEDSNHEGTTLLSAVIQLGHSQMIKTVLDFLFESTSDEKLRAYFALQDARGRSCAHYLFQAPFLIQHLGHMVPWRQRDRNGQTPLFALCRSYDHPSYHQMVEDALAAATASQGDGQPLHVDDHVDAKGNTLLHIINDAQLALRILQTCDVDVNATNEKHFTALMVASKYSRYDLARALYSDARVDPAAKDLRGLTAAELAKDDDVRNKIDDLTLFTLSPTSDMRTTGVVRGYFVEDASVRFVLKSGAPIDKLSYAVTTCRRSLSDFEHLARLLAMDSPASWIPSIDNLRTPTQILSKPSRAVLKDLQNKMDWFLRVLLAHPTFATHETLWEFFLVPDLQLDTMEQRTKLKVEARSENVRDECEPVEDLGEVEQFVRHARDMVRSVHFSTRSVARRSNALGAAACDLYEASQYLAKSMRMLEFLPQSHRSGFEFYVQSLMPMQSSPCIAFFTAFLTLFDNIEAVLRALERPPQLSAQIAAMRREAERSYNSIGRSSRWPLGLLDETRQRLNEEREDKARRNEVEAENLSKELRYTQQTVASELAGWREMHEKMGRRAIRDLARSMLMTERMRLDGIRRALRRARQGAVAPFAGGPPEVNGHRAARDRMRRLPKGHGNSQEDLVVAGGSGGLPGLSRRQRGLG